MCPPHRVAGNRRATMRKLRYSWSAPVLVLVLAGPAAATTLVSPALRVGKGDFPACNIVNAGTEDITVKAELFGVNNDVIDQAIFTVSAGSQNGNATGGVTGNCHCRFSGAFSKRDVRASMDVLSGSD